MRVYFHKYCPKLKEIVELQDIIEKGDSYYKSKHEKTYSFSKYSLSILWGIH